MVNLSVGVGGRGVGAAARSESTSLEQAVDVGEVVVDGGRIGRAGGRGRVGAGGRCAGLAWSAGCRSVAGSPVGPARRSRPGATPVSASVAAASAMIFFMRSPAGVATALDGRSLAARRLAVGQRHVRGTYGPPDDDVGGGRYRGRGLSVDREGVRSWRWRSTASTGRARSPR